jgi:hypothetical protein
MNKIFAKRYAFCDFSKIVGFPNPVPSRDEWENSLPRFRGEDWEVPAEHLLDFHDCIHRLQVVHEDVQIWLFCFSLEGIARDWYWSLPIASISSLADFHAAFHLFSKGIFSADLLFPECCHEFNLLTKDSDNHEEYVVIGDTSHCDRDIDDLHNVSHSIDAFDIVPNASIVLGCQEDQIVPFEDLKDDEQIDRSTGESIGSAVDVEGSPHLPDLQIKGSCLNHKEQGDIFPDLFQDFIVDPAIQEASSLSLGSYLDTPIFDPYSDEEEDVKVCEDLLFTQISSSSSFQQRDDKKCVHTVIDACHESVVQKFNEDLFSLDISCKDIVGEEIVCCDKPTYHHDEFRLQRYVEGEQKVSDQRFNLHFSSTKVEQSTFSIEISESNQQLQYSQLEQQLEEVFLYGFKDPFANYLETMNNIHVKVFLSDEICLYHLFKPLFGMIWLPLFLGLR